MEQAEQTICEEVCVAYVDGSSTSAEAGGSGHLVVSSATETSAAAGATAGALQVVLCAPVAVTSGVKLTRVVAHGMFNFTLSNLICKFVFFTGVPVLGNLSVTFQYFDSSFDVNLTARDLDCSFLNIFNRCARDKSCPQVFPPKPPTFLSDNKRGASAFCDATRTCRTQLFT